MKNRSFKAAAINILKSGTTHSVGLAAFGAVESVGTAMGVAADYFITLPVEGFPKAILLHNFPAFYYLNDKISFGFYDILFSVKDLSYGIATPAMQASAAPLWEVQTLAFCAAAGFCVFLPIALRASGWAMNVTENAISGRRPQIIAAFPERKGFSSCFPQFKK